MFSNGKGIIPEHIIQTTIALVIGIVSTGRAFYTFLGSERIIYIAKRHKPKAAGPMIIYFAGYGEPLDGYVVGTTIGSVDGVAIKGNRFSHQRQVYLHQASFQPYQRSRVFIE